MDFGQALQAMKDGNAVSRTEWNEEGLNARMRLQVPDEHSKMTKPYFYMDYMLTNAETLDVEFIREPAVLASGNILANDWYVVE